MGSHFHTMNRMMMIFMAILGLGFCLLRIQQEPFVSGCMESTVKLGCYLSHDEEAVERITIYWAINKTGSKLKYLYPPADASQDRVKEVRVKGDVIRDMTVSVSQLQLADTELYYCYGSILLGPRDKSDNVLKSGNGTMLFVHGPIRVELNASQIICKTQVKTVKDVVLDWRFQGRDASLGEMSYTPAQSPAGSYWITSSLNVDLDRCVGNETFYCQLHYNSHHNIANGSMVIPCKGKLQVEMNGSEITCMAPMSVAEDVSLEWRHKNRSLGKNSSPTQHPDGSYWITSRVNVNLEQCIGNNTFYCQLNHKFKPNIAIQSIEVSCKGEPVLRHPVHLYFLLLGSTALILVVVILVSLKRRQCGPERRQHKVKSPRYKFI